MLRNLFSGRQKINQLGRWNLEKSNIKSLLANIDSCGDTMCGDPKAYREYMDKEIKELLKLQYEERMKEEERKKKNSFKLF